MERVRRYSWTDSGRRNIKRELKEIKDLASEFLYYPTEEKKDIFDLITIPFVTLNWKLNPLWIQIIGPAGSGKTEHVGLTKPLPTTEFISSMTENSLISGFRDESSEEDFSLLPHLNGKVLIIKDFTTILQLRPEKT